MSEHKSMDVQCSPDMGCRICHSQADVAYILCPEHQGLTRAAPDLLAALEEITRRIEAYDFTTSPEHIRDNPDIALNALEAVKSIALDAIKKAPLPA